MAMSKLYPPVIEGILPAFYDTLKIPFIMNRSVAEDEYIGISISIKDSVSGSLKKTYKVYKDSEKEDNDGKIKNHIVIINNIDKSAEYVIGMFYKIQIAYISLNDEIGYYSTIGTAKCTGEAEINVLDLIKDQLNSERYEYKAEYNNSDKSEKIYQYKFNIYKQSDYLNKEIFETSDWILHNSIDNYISFQPKNKITDNNWYELEVEIITINNYHLKSSIFKIVKEEFYPKNLELDGNIEVNEEEGYVLININSLEQISEDLIGTYYILRSSEDDNYAYWEKIDTFKIEQKEDYNYSFYDFTAECGKNYKYALQEYNSYGVLSSMKILNKNPILVEYQYAYLYDGNRQLKLGYNVNISSLTPNILETKQNILGRKYPVFMKSGIVNYKEFQIEALLSYLHDEEFHFVTEDEIQKRVSYKDIIPFDKTVNRENNKMELSTTLGDKKQYSIPYNCNTNSSNTNFAIEKYYRDQVLDFLTNDQIKLYKSPSEGNMLVKVHTTSLTPEQQLGRMIWNLSSTITEMDELNRDNLIKYKIISEIQPLSINTMGNKSYTFLTQEGKYSKEELAPEGKVIKKVEIIGLPMGSIIMLDNEKHEIGNTNNLYIDNCNYQSLKIFSIPQIKDNELLYIKSFQINLYYDEIYKIEEFDKVQKIVVSDLQVNTLTEYNQYPSLSDSSNLQHLVYFGNLLVEFKADANIEPNTEYAFELNGTKITLDGKTRYYYQDFIDFEKGIDYIPLKLLNDNLQAIYAYQYKYYEGVEK